MMYAFDISLFSLLSFVLIGHCDCLKVERFNHVGYIMNCLSITSHCYACENCLVKQMTTLTMTRLRTSLMSNDLTRKMHTLYFILGPHFMHSLYLESKAERRFFYVE